MTLLQKEIVFADTGKNIIFCRRFFFGKLMDLAKITEEEKVEELPKTKKDLTLL